MKRHGSAPLSARSPCFNVQPINGDKLPVTVDLPLYGLKWCNPPDLNPVCFGTQSSSMQTTFSRRTAGMPYAIEFRTMCYSASSCCRVHLWRPLQSYAVFTLSLVKLASRHLLLYVVYNSQKSLNFMDALSCKRQNESWPRLIWPTLLGLILHYISLYAKTVTVTVRAVKIMLAPIVYSQLSSTMFT